MIEKLTFLPAGVVTFACHGQVTAADYTETLIPEIERHLREHRKLRVYYEIAPDFTGYDPGAMWEDAKFGLGHLSAWGRVAIVTDVSWMSRAIGLFAPLVPGEIRVFPLAEAAAAREWVAAE